MWKIRKWSLTSLQQRLVKTGGRLVKHARSYWLLLAESHLTRRTVWSHTGQDRSATITSGLGEPPAGPDFKRRAGRRVSEEWVERETGSCLVILRSGKTGPFRPRWKHPTLKTRLAIAVGGGQAYIVGRAGVHSGNSGRKDVPHG